MRVCAIDGGAADGVDRRDSRLLPVTGDSGHDADLTAPTGSCNGTVPRGIPTASCSYLHSGAARRPTERSSPGRQYRSSPWAGTLRLLPPTRDPWDTPTAAAHSGSLGHSDCCRPLGIPWTLRLLPPTRDPWDTPTAAAHSGSLGHSDCCRPRGIPGTLRLLPPTRDPWDTQTAAAHSGSPGHSDCCRPLGIARVIPSALHGRPRLAQPWRRCPELAVTKNASREPALSCAVPVLGVTFACPGYTSKRPLY